MFRFVLFVSILWQLAFCFRPTFNSKTFRSCSMSTEDNKPKKNTMFDRVVDDFIGKRYGAGEAFYGKRTSRLTEEEYAQTRGQKRVYDKNAPMEDDAILIVGSVEDMGQWVAFELDGKGFNIRLATSSMKESMDIFGFPGYNADMIELQGDLSSEEDYAKAVNGVQAIIICTNFSPSSESNKAKQEQEFTTAVNLINLAIKARAAKVGNVKKIVMISRYIPEYLNSNPDGLTTILQKPADSEQFKEFRTRHEKLERIIRNSNFEYVIVRAPPFVPLVREPSQKKLSLFAARETVPYLPPIKVGNNPIINWLDEKMNAATIGILDLAEVVTQSLLQDVTGITFSVFETDSVDTSPLPNKPEIIAGQKELENTRILRNAYYSVFNMTDEQLRTSYMMKSAEEYQAQLSEDADIEKYWLTRLTLLQKDSD